MPWMLGHFQLLAPVSRILPFSLYRVYESIPLLTSKIRHH